MTFSVEHRANLNRKEKKKAQQNFKKLKKGKSQHEIY